MFVGDTYVPVTTQLRSRPISTPDQAATDWRLQTFEGWGDARRQGFNNTRVQRKYFYFPFCNKLHAELFSCSGALVIVGSHIVIPCILLPFVIHF